MNLNSKTTQPISILIKAISTIMIGIFLLSSCSSATTVLSEPKNAKIYLNGEYAGETPYHISNTLLTGTCLSLELRKEGYADKNVRICKNEEVNVGAVIGGIFFLFPFMWTMGYKDIHNYEMEREGTVAPSHF